MINANIVKQAFKQIAQTMKQNNELLTKLDSAAGDGDLGISMEQGFHAVAAFLENENDTDLGRLLIRASAVLNEASPSTLGTVLSVGLMAGGRTLKGVEECGIEQAAVFLETGCDAIMTRSKCSPGEKTILDALIPAAKAVRACADSNGTLAQGAKDAAKAAADGCAQTVDMMAVHGRAAYYAEKTIGLQDGGATVAKILFETVSDCAQGDTL